jgi:hypothetical protein
LVSEIFDFRYTLAGFRDQGNSDIVEVTHGFDLAILDSILSGVKPPATFLSQRMFVTLWFFGWCFLP